MAPDPAVRPFRLTDCAKAGGCAGKLGPADLSDLLRSLPPAVHPDLLVGTNTSDDAGVFRLRDDLALVQTVDFFSPIVDDPFQFGGIAAANALSDVYAMGGTPITALNVAAFPREGVAKEILADILRGAQAKAAEVGVVVVGGHTIADDEVKFGMAVTGVIHPDRVRRNVGARPGDRVLLTKPLGTGLVSTAIKRQYGGAALHQAAIDGMLRLNAAAARALDAVTVHACTDVTGFALMGHGYEMAHGSGVRIEFTAADLPLLPGVEELVAGGFITGGCKRVREWLAPSVAVEPAVPDHLVEVTFDPQTSGGLLVAVPEEEADRALSALAAAGVAAVGVGRVTAHSAGEPWIRLR